MSERERPAAVSEEEDAPPRTDGEPVDAAEPSATPSEPMDGTAERTVDRATDEAVDTSVDAAVDTSVDAAVDTSVDAAVDRSVDVAGPATLANDLPAAPEAHAAPPVADTAVSVPETAPASADATEAAGANAGAAGEPTADVPGADTSAPATGLSTIFPPREQPADVPPTKQVVFLRRPRNIVLIALVTIVALVGVIFGPMAWRVWSERDVRLTTPQRVAGLELDDSQGAHDTVDYLRTAMETGVTLDHTTGGVYADSTGEPTSVVFVGGTGTLVSPADALNKTFSLITDEAGGVENVREVPAGPLGGTMKCGSTTTDGNEMAVCGWADHGSLGIAMFPNRPVDQSADLLRKMRKAMQNRD